MWAPDAAPSVSNWWKMMCGVGRRPEAAPEPDPGPSPDLYGLSWLASMYLPRHSIIGEPHRIALDATRVCNGQQIKSCYSIFFLRCCRAELYLVTAGFTRETVHGRRGRGRREVARQAVGSDGGNASSQFGRVVIRDGLFVVVDPLQQQLPVGVIPVRWRAVFAGR